MTMTATEAQHINGTVRDSSDLFSIGRHQSLAQLIEGYKADVKLQDNGSVYITVSNGMFYLMELA